MAFAGISYLAVAIAAAASFIFGGVWYGILGKQWMIAANLKEQDIKDEHGRPKTLTPMAIAVVAQFVMAFVLAGVIGHLGPGQVTLRNSLITALFIWVGFIATTLVVNHSFRGAKPMLTLIDGGHWLGVLLIQGAILGLIGV